MATQIQLANIARQDEFQKRVGYALVGQALSKLSGTPTSPDILLGQRVLKAEENILQWCLGVVSDATIAAGAHNESGSTITDPQITGAIASIWDRFAL